ncbi:MAG: ACP S-malonyltransferase [Spirochaetales bacterium]|jgi:[acyl-carrier-protein] S-malonyltransferase|nr:ACP S-malonyltransferase [Spirochaetales bacterium]
MKKCFLYPGQGAQYPGMGKDLWDASDEVKKLFADASDQTGMKLQEILFDGSEEDLKKTENTQVAVTLVNLAAATYLEEQGLVSDYCAGFSLGEYSALVDSGVLARSDIFKIVQTRGEIMARTVESYQEEWGNAGMAAVLGLEFEEALPVLDDLADEDVFLANHSSPNQIVIAGTSAGLEKADLLFEKAGALRFIRLKVSGPFHSPLMASAAGDLAEYLDDVDFADPTKPVYANVTGRRIVSGDDARKLCIDQITSPVLWVTSELHLLQHEPDKVIEVGPGKVLTGLWKSYTKQLRCLPAGTTADINSLTQR